MQIFRVTKKAFTVLGWLACCPFRLACLLYAGFGQIIGAGFLLGRDDLPCPGCGQSISLLGRWQCTCHYVFDGFYFMRCPVCGAKPPYIHCQRCGVGIKNPMDFP
jgi:hypothetical protein